MKVLLFMPYIATPSTGVNTVSFNIFQGLLQESAQLEKFGLDVLVVSNSADKISPPTTLSLSENVELLSFKKLPITTLMGDLDCLVRVLNRKQIMAEIALIHSHDIWFTFPATYTFRGPIFHNIHGLPWKEVYLTNSMSGAFSNRMRTLRKQLIKKSNKVSFVCISPYVYNEVRDFLGIKKNLRIIPDPLSEDVFNVTKRVKQGLIFYPARLIPRKNHIVLIRALAHLKGKAVSDFTLALTGNIEDTKYFRQIITEIEKNDLSKNVLFLGKISREKLLDLYSQAHVVVLTSLEESFSLVVAEAMATGTPVVASPVGIVPDVIKDGKNGLIVDPTNPKDIADKLFLLLNDNVLSRTIGAAGQDVAKQWLPRRVVNDLIALWREKIE